MSGFAGVVPTGIPERGYDGPEAELMRQERVVGDVKNRNPEVVERMKAASLALSAARDEYDAARLALTAATGPGNDVDVLQSIDRDVKEEKTRAALIARGSPKKKS